MEQITTTPKFVRWALLLGIVVILNVFFSVVLSIAYPAPEYETYCPAPKINPTDEATCSTEGGSWVAYVPARTEVQGLKTEGYCDMYEKCRKPYEDARENHALRAFVLMVSLGVLALILGFIPLGSSIVSSGLSYGGVVALIIGSAQYWGTAGQWVRLAIATVGLLALIYIGWKRFRD